MTLWKTADGVSLDALAEEATAADLLAVVRRGVESGEIEASEIECFFCEGMGEVVHDIDCEQCALDGGLKHAHACPECRGAGGLRVVVIGPDGGL